MGKFNRIFYVSWVLILFSFGIVEAQQATPPPAKPTPPPAAAKHEARPEDTKQPSDQWLKDYDGYMQLGRVIAQMKADNGIDKLEEQLAKRVQALLVQIPPGYQFDQATKKFVLPPKPGEAVAPKQ